MRQLVTHLSSLSVVPCLHSPASKVDRSERSRVTDRCRNSRFSRSRCPLTVLYLIRRRLLSWPLLSNRTRSPLQAKVSLQLLIKLKIRPTELLQQILTYKYDWENLNYGCATVYVVLLRLWNNYQIFINIMYWHTVYTMILSVGYTIHTQIPPLFY